MIQSPSFPPLHTVHASFPAHGVPSILLTSNKIDSSPSPRTFQFLWLAFPTSDYYGTADFPQSSLPDTAPITESQTFLYLYPLYETLRLLPYTVKTEYTLSHSYCVFHISISTYMGNTEKQTISPSLFFLPFGNVQFLRCCITSSFE